MSLSNGRPGEKPAWSGWRCRCVAVAIGFLPMQGLAQVDTVRCEENLSARDEAGASYALLPGVSWAGWNAMLGQHWTTEDRARVGWSDFEGMIKAASASPLDTTYHAPEREVRTAYIPRDPASTEQQQAYAIAAAHYGAGEFARAIELFDEIAAVPQSPYAAASAYSAARATLDLGDFAAGLRRTGAIIAEPRWQESHQAAKHLVGTLAYKTGASPLVAARLADITHLLAAPPDLQCRYADLRALVLEAEQDFAWILKYSYPTDRWSDYEPWSGHTRGVMRQAGQTSPVIDLARVLAAPTPFMRNGPWFEPLFPDLIRIPGVRPEEQDVVARSSADGAALTAYARAKAIETGNPLWAYALATRTTDAADIALLRKAEAAADAAPVGAKQRNVLKAWLVAHQARILLMSGQRNEAMGVGQRLRNAWLPSSWFDPRVLLSEGGIRYLLSKRDLTGARAWAAAFYQPEPYSERPFKVALSLTWEEALAAEPRQADRQDQDLSGLDLLPARRLIELSRTTSIPVPIRRKILLAAWTRTYMLGDEKAFRGLFPDVLANFPEVAADLDDAERAWFPSTRRHRFTRLLLRLPGLSPRPSWVGNAEKLAAIRSADPSDGNWWCPADPLRSERDFFASMFGNISSFSSDSKASLAYPYTYDSALGPEKPRFDALAHDWIAWHPLYKEADLDELKRLSQVESGPVRLGREAIDWANGSTRLSRWLRIDAGLPETLALAVRATRWGCRRTGPIDRVSEDAWRALHRLYPDSIPTARTRYWFDMRLDRPATAP